MFGVRQDELEYGDKQHKHQGNTMWLI